MVDAGDIIGARGGVKRTEKGELSVVAASVQILTKSLAPLPDKWHGLADIEKRYRQRCANGLCLLFPFKCIPWAVRLACKLASVQNQERTMNTDTGLLLISRWASKQCQGSLIMLAGTWRACQAVCCLRVDDGMLACMLNSKQGAPSMCCRYVDLIVTEGVRDTLRARARMMGALRRTLESHGFLEVETPVLETSAGGADARPFATWHNALDQAYVLRIATGAAFFVHASPQHCIVHYNFDCWFIFVILFSCLFLCYWLFLKQIRLLPGQAIHEPLPCNSAIAD